MDKQLAKTYEPSEVEDRIYKFWVDGGYFHAEIDKKKKPYTIVIPPPNITGQLHMGHALDNTMQDILIRWRRMQGYSALWIPGTDHASIATEAKIVEALAKEGLSKEAIGREEFLKRAWAWKDKFSGRIISQLKKLGTSCDWDRTRFTLDEGCSKAVREVFCNLYDKGLIYRGERIINWCPHCLTSISDAEVEYEEKDGFFWHLRYPLSDGSGSVELATTRPETLLGDTAVAVHPEDDRYKHLIGKTVILPLVGREIPIIADEYVERDFGTGVVKITPAHDPNDFEVGLRHHLPVINVMRDNAEINENGGKYEGLSRDEARKRIVADLEAGGYLVKTEPIKHNVGACYRCHTIVEPRVSKQWFVKMKPLAEPAIEAVRDEEVKFVPDRFAKIYYHWMENIKDWCISRQLWWGHRIPAWYCSDCGETIVARETPDVCPKCGGKHLHQDPDTLDTWFSSALWPFSTLGWPDKTPELEYFYPTDTLVTSYDIIFFWVARMIFSGIEHTGKAPFNTVYIHGLMRDAQGRKMSKSLGNGIDPLEVVDKYGADALRFTLATGNSAGNDMRYIPERVESNRNFCNKIWNACRFIIMNIGDEKVAPGLPKELLPEDKWILSEYNRLVAEVTDNLEKFELGVAGQKVYDFIWNSFCDWYIELAKTRLNAGGDAADSARRILIYVMSNTLKLLHPFMPFITEEIWQALPHKGDTIMLAKWPVYDKRLNFPEEEADMERIMAAIRAIRNRRAEMGVPPSKKTHVFIETEYRESFDSAAQFFARLAGASDLKTGDRFVIPNCVRMVSDGATIYIPLGELVDIEKELARLGKDKQSCEKQLAQTRAKLSNVGFTSKAPEAVVAAERDKEEKLSQKLAALEQSIKEISK
jgi:valyl-tRNA synthetase